MGRSMFAGLIRKAVLELTLRAEEPFVLRSQLESLAKQLPYLYATLCFNATLLSITHASIAPFAMIVTVPVLLIPLCIMRVFAWRKIKVADQDDDSVRKRLQRSVLLVGVLGLSFTAWSHALFGYGDDMHHAHVVFFMGITVVGCVFCLVHVRPAALLLTAIVVVPFVLRFGTSGESVLIALAINLLAVAVLMILMMLSYYDDSRRLVHSTKQLSMLGEQHRLAAQLDSLTGLGNRRRFFQDLESATLLADRDCSPFAIGLIDLDGFKPINDVHGHQVGDEVLVEVGRRLLACTSNRATIARLGGDEFALVISGNNATENLEAIGETICNHVARPIVGASGHLAVTASIGFAVYPDMGRTQEQLFERADFALYHAKDHCRGTAVIFTEEHAVKIGDRRRLEHELKQADLSAELWLAFQPIVDVNDDRIIACEALARWTSPALGLVSPGLFIPAAERLGMVSVLTQVLFRKACEAARTWPAAVRLSFNLSVDDLIDDAHSTRLVAMVGECGLPAEQIIFEITETAVMRDFAKARATLQALRALGCSIALDDFGTGFSSLSYVNRLPLDKLKIDQSFVRSISADRTSRTIVESIRGLSENLGIDCVVEGVETLEQVGILREIGCPKMQGYFFGRPMDALAILLRLTATPPVPLLPALTAPAVMSALPAAPARQPAELAA